MTQKLSDRHSNELLLAIFQGAIAKQRMSSFEINQFKKALVISLIREGYGADHGVSRDPEKGTCADAQTKA